MKTRLSWSDMVYKTVALMIVWTVVVACLYPFLFVFSSSISDPFMVNQNKIFLWPRGFSLEAYSIVFQYPMLQTAYVNTLFYTLVGTFCNMLLTATTAYPLSKKNLFGRNYFLMMIVATMLFSGGMIPLYLIVKGLYLLDTRWAIIIPSVINTFNMILLKTFFESIPKELEEAAVIDGCSQWKLLFRIIIPLSMPAIATISLFYGVGHWNAFFDAMIYLSDSKLFPVQIFLRDIVIAGQTTEMVDRINVSVSRQILTQSLVYATIMVVAMPILIVYPFIQKYFVKGVMIGSLKG